MERGWDNKVSMETGNDSMAVDIKLVKINKNQGGQFWIISLSVY